MLKIKYCIPPKTNRKCSESKYKYVCINCEWNHSMERHKVALLTLLHENQCILIRLCKMNLSSGILLTQLKVHLK